MALKIRTKLLLAILAVLLLAMGAATYHEADENSRLSTQDLDQKAQLLADIYGNALANPLWDFNVETIKSIVSSLSADTDFHRAEVHDSNGRTVTTLGNSQLAPEQQLMVEKPIVYNDQGQAKPLGTIRIAFSRQGVVEKTADSTRRTLISNAVQILAAGLGVLLAAAVLLRPLNALTGVAAKLATGDFAVTIPATKLRDEIGHLARVIDQLRLASIERIRLEQANRDAETRALAQQQAELREREERRTQDDARQREDTARQTAIVDAMARAMRELSAGNLRHRINTDFPAAYAAIKDDYNDAIGKIGQIVRDIVDNTAHITDGMRQITSGTQDLALRTESQASSLEETAAAMNQVTATVKKNAETSRVANSLASEAEAAAERGSAIAGNVVSAMDRIEQSATRIVDIVGLIDEIAFQTNLLALNASVEAARAGDAGKGFAVVAQEVRGLAQRSANASKDIKLLITESNSHVKDGAKLVHQAGSSLTEIQTAASKVSELVSDISGASEEQAVALDEVNNAVNGMDELTQRNGALVEQVTASIQSIAEQTRQLQEMVAFFQTSNAA